MKLGVISDTHAQTLSQLPEKLRLALSRVDLIVHAGDFTEKAVLDGLRTLGEVKAVYGNMDHGELMRILPQKDLFVVRGKKVGLVHGSGAPWGHSEMVRSQFQDADIIICGHSHLPDSRYIRGVLVFNPGQARKSFGLLNIDDEVNSEIVLLDEPADR